MNSSTFALFNALREAISFKVTEYELKHSLE